MCWLPGWLSITAACHHGDPAARGAELHGRRRPRARPVLFGPDAPRASRIRDAFAARCAAVTCAAAWLLMRWATRAERFLPKTLLRALERNMGLLHAAVAVEFIAGGARELLRAP